MAVKKTPNPVRKTKKKSEPRGKGKVKNTLECGICGYRVIVDETCGCVEEHVLLCCGRPMAKM